MNSSSIRCPRGHESTHVERTGQEICNVCKSSSSGEFMRCKPCNWDLCKTCYLNHMDVVQFCWCGKPMQITNTETVAPTKGGIVHDTLQCNVCHNLLSPGTAVSLCKTCLYGVCASCYGDERESMVHLSVYCPGKRHKTCIQLPFCKSNICSICEKQLEADKFVYACRKCDYNVCTSCVFCAFNLCCKKEGHIMSRTPAIVKNPTMTCSGCNQVIMGNRLNPLAFSCRTCPPGDKWSLCGKCTSQSIVPCPHPQQDGDEKQSSLHVLKLTTISSTFACDACQRSIPAGQVMYSCRKHNLDFCLKCIFQRKGEANVNQQQQANPTTAQQERPSDQQTQATIEQLRKLVAMQRLQQNMANTQAHAQRLSQMAQSARQSTTDHILNMQARSAESSRRAAEAFSPYTYCRCSRNRAYNCPDCIRNYG